MSRTPSSNPDEPFDCEYGCQPMDHGIEPDDTDDEPTQPVKYITPTHDAKSKALGNYTSMIKRNPDGSDPLVQEPKDK